MENLAPTDSELDLPRLSVQPTAPMSPSLNDLWFDTDEENGGEPNPAINIESVPASGAAQTLEWAIHPVEVIYDVVMDQDCTFSLGADPGAGELGTIVLWLSGAFTPTLPAGILWAGGNPPAYGSPGKFLLEKVGSGSLWGYDLGQNFA